MIFNYAVNDDKIIFTNTVVYTGNVNTYECKFSFSPKWDSYDKFAVFSGDKNYTVPIADNSCKIPKEVLMSENTVYIGVFGSSNENGTDILSTSLAPIKVSKGAYNEDITESLTPAPEIWQEYINTITGLMSHSVPKIGEDNCWHLWNNEKNAYETTGVNAKGDMSYNIIPLESPNLLPDKIYSIELLENIDFVLPEITDGKYHQILIHAIIDGTPAVSYGTECYFNNSIPDINGVACDIFFEFNGWAWIAGAISIGVVEE
ncbi:MAG: hypothetical protein J5984_03590 [Clostridia bacterium]|nr:hypothetical protein [Clostridia bacterium]